MVDFCPYSESGPLIQQSLGPFSFCLSSVLPPFPPIPWRSCKKILTRYRLSTLEFEPLELWKVSLLHYNSQPQVFCHPSIKWTKKPLNLDKFYFCLLFLWHILIVYFKTHFSHIFFGHLFVWYQFCNMAFYRKKKRKWIIFLWHGWPRFVLYYWYGCMKHVTSHTDLCAATGLCTRNKGVLVKSTGTRWAVLGKREGIDKRGRVRRVGE